MTKNHPYNETSAIRISTKNFIRCFTAIVCLVLLTDCSGNQDNIYEINLDAKIFPEYYILTIPPNIAPLNFIIKEPGSKFRVEISAGKSNPIVIRQSSPSIRIPPGEWHDILTNNAGKTLTVDIMAFNNNKWNKYKVIRHTISTDPIDPYLVYRLIHAVYLMWRDMGIYQRNLTNFDEIPVIENSSTDYGCFNCHSFSKKDPSKMLLHFRILHPGTLLWNNGVLSTIDTRTSYTMSGGIYPSWHPDGKHIAFSVGKLSPHLTTRKDKVVDVSDKASDLIVYDIENKKVITSPRVSTNRRENMPVWSADGKYLYFISAPEAIKGDDDSRLHCKYDLMRIAYDIERNSWGEAELVLSSEETGMSISMPSVSPDGKYMVCSMSDYGYFTIFDKKSDLYSVNLETREFKKLELNSNNAESYSTWSSNGRWLVFSSKRMDGVFTRPFIAYFDTNGIAHTPFVLPQKNPEVYNRLLANFNRPELITGKIELTPIEVRNAVLNNDQK
jgi:dipeptidyl aminopeptidase/acylaminoacyl peptidase